MKEEDVEKKSISRRNFLKTAGGAAAVAGLAASGISMTAGSAQAADALPKKWDDAVDVVVIGSGFAGLAAAIEAKEAGASVAVYEKMPMHGGNSIINGGVMAVAGSDMQEARGIKDTPDLMLADMMKAGLYLNYPELARMVAYESKPAYDWCKQHLGVKFTDPKMLLHMGGHTVARSCPTSIYSGAEIVNKELAKFKELGGRVSTGTYIEKLIQNSKGRIVGVQIRKGYRFPKADSGKVQYIKAKKAVVLGSGGFSQDVAFRMTQDPKLVADVHSTNQPGATAEVLKEALRVGGTPVQISWIQSGPWASPDEKGFGLAPHFATGPVFSYGIMVDPKTGKRFISELADRKIRADAIIRIGHAAIGISDDEGQKSCGGPPGTVGKLVERGVVKKYDTLEDLSKAYDIPYADLKQSVDNYNAYLKTGVDKEFGRYMQPDAKPIEKAPFYAVRLWPKVHHTMGGVQINTEARVIGLDGKPIGGLFAAGEVAGGIHGAVRLGSCAVVDCLVFGRIAGKNAAKEKAWS
jgi:flavocytochrome c